MINTLSATPSLLQDIGQSDDWNGSKNYDQEKNIFQSLKELQPANIFGSPANPKESGLSDQLLNATTAAKRSLSNVAMYFSTEWRQKLSHQIDMLHDIDEWIEGEKPINVLSFNTFITTALVIKPKSHPNLALSYKGNLIAMWRATDHQLIVEFLSNGDVKWLTSGSFEGKGEQASGLAIPERLISHISGFNPENWFEIKHV